MIKFSERTPKLSLHFLIGCFLNNRLGYIPSLDFNPHPSFPWAVAGAVLLAAVFWSRMLDGWPTLALRYVLHHTLEPVLRQTRWHYLSMAHVAASSTSYKFVVPVAKMTGSSRVPWAPNLRLLRGKKKLRRLHPLEKQLKKSNICSLFFRQPRYDNIFGCFLKATCFIENFQASRSHCHRSKDTTKARTEKKIDNANIHLLRASL